MGPPRVCLRAFCLVIACRLPFRARAPSDGTIMIPRDAPASGGAGGPTIVDPEGLLGSALDPDSPQVIARSTHDGELAGGCPEAGWPGRAPPPTGVLPPPLRAGVCALVTGRLVYFSSPRLQALHAHVWACAASLVRRPGLGWLRDWSQSCPGPPALQQRHAVVRLGCRPAAQSHG
jgi:hypothetical protein